VGERKLDMCIFTSSCKGFSALTHVGLVHEETKLFLTALDIVGRLRPALVFMENVPGILTANGGRDYKTIERHFARMGYSLDFGIFTASELGAPHLRRRWYALAVRKDADRAALGARVRDLFAESHAVRFPRWDLERERKFQHRVERSTDDRHRLMALGNAVVPLCVRNAFHKLTQGVPLIVPRPIAREFVLDPALGAKPRSAAAHRDPLTAPLHTKNLPTPRAGNWSDCAALTYRCAYDLGTAVRFMRGLNGDRFNGITNPRFVEYMMGFPQDWTRLPS
jgi:site-specific DNA-cytosine methylase